MNNSVHSAPPEKGCRTCDRLVALNGFLISLCWSGKTPIHAGSSPAAPHTAAWF